MSISLILEAFDSISSQFENRDALLVNIVYHSLKTGVKNPLRGKDLGKILSGERNISKGDASFILDKENFDEVSLDSFIEKELKAGNENFNRDELYSQIKADSNGLSTESMTKDNVGFYLKQVWITYLKKMRECKTKTKFPQKGRY